VTHARDGLLRLLSTTGTAPLANALIAAVGALQPAAVTPLTVAAASSEQMRPIVVDASNIARHDPDPLARAAVGGGGPVTAARVSRLTTIRDLLLKKGFFPVFVIADANLRFHVDDRGAYLALIERGMVQETLPGVVADEVLIATAREHDAPLVTNDRLSDWAEARDVERLGFAILPDGIVLTPF
jgi:hypothetical protein